MIKQYLMDPTVGKLIAAMVGFIVIISIIKLLQRSMTRYIKDTDTRYRARKLIGGVGYVLGVLLLGIIFSDRLGKLTVAFGVAGAGIAFALQEVIASIAGWVAISFGRFFKPGDRIQLGGIRGDVIDIGLLRTTLMECGEWINGDQYNGRIVRISNSFVFKEAVFNYSADFPFLWDEITIPVRHGSDVQTVKNILFDTAMDIVGSYTTGAETEWKHVVDKYMIEAATVSPSVSLTADENWMTFTLRYVVDYKERRKMKTQLFEKIIQEFSARKDRVEIATAASELQVTGMPKMEIQVQN